MERGLIATLFDLSFDVLLTTKLVRFTYVTLLVGAGMVAVGVGFAGFARGFLSGLVTLLIFAPLIFLVAAVFARIYCELVLVLFRIQAHTAETAELLRSGASAAGTARSGSAV
jgi:Domain of unknown function (DUF4282)